eukprot:comp24099_c0_seq2/m.43477 comp24099_c0_seq2/g.43477  ORF comp24099_c0_seq2/g.43477 comp24099_c0_seq2/m.43477 type:complete len:398 (-) comp24099_c0_seq2:30-1223(-)
MPHVTTTRDRLHVNATQAMQGTVSRATISTSASSEMTVPVLCPHATTLLAPSPAHATRGTVETAECAKKLTSAPRRLTIVTSMPNAPTLPDLGAANAIPDMTVTESRALPSTRAQRTATTATPMRSATAPAQAHSPAAATWAGPELERHVPIPTSVHPTEETIVTTMRRAQTTTAPSPVLATGDMPERGFPAKMPTSARGITRARVWLNVSIRLAHMPAHAPPDMHPSEILPARTLTSVHPTKTTATCSPHVLTRPGPSRVHHARPGTQEMVSSAATLTSASSRATPVPTWPNAAIRLARSVVPATKDTAAMAQHARTLTSAATMMTATAMPRAPIQSARLLAAATLVSPEPAFRAQTSTSAMVATTVTSPTPNVPTLSAPSPVHVLLAMKETVSPV